MSVRRSAPVVSSVRPSGEMSSLPTSPACPGKRCATVRCATSQATSLPASSPVTRVCESGVNSSALIAAACSAGSERTAPEARSRSRTRPSGAPSAYQRPSGLDGAGRVAGREGPQDRWAARIELPRPLRAGGVQPAVRRAQGARARAEPQPARDRAARGVDAVEHRRRPVGGPGEHGEQASEIDHVGVDERLGIADRGEVDPQLPAAAAADRSRRRAGGPDRAG